MSEQSVDNGGVSRGRVALAASLSDNSPPPHSGPAGPKKGFFTKKILCTEKIIYLSILGLKCPQWLKSPPV